MAWRTVSDEAHPAVLRLLRRGIAGPLLPRKLEGVVPGGREHGH